MNDREFLQYFETLKSNKQDVVLSTSDKINKSVLAGSHIKKDQPAKENQEKLQSKFGKGISDELNYALKRLVNGTISTNAQVQLNFSFCLTQLFKTHKQVLNVKDIIEHVSEISNKKLAINKTEVNMFAIGRNYIFKAIAKSQIIEAKPETCDSIVEYLFEIMIQDFQAYDFLQEGILEVFKIFLQSKVGFKHKLKQLINKGKFLLKEHTSISIQYLTILYLACEKHQVSFSYEQNLQEKVFNQKNLLKALEGEVLNFPKKSASFTYIIQYMKSATKSNADRKKEIWEDFFKFLLKELNHGHKSFYVILNLYYQFIKQAELEDLQYIMVQDLIHLQLRNLAVMNNQMKKIAQKIDSKIIKLLAKHTQFSEEQQKIILNLLTIMKTESTFSFTPKYKLASSILSSLSQEKVDEYYRFLKHQLHKALEPTDRKFYINEIYILGELLYGKISEDLFLEISFLLFEQANQTKLKLVFSKIPDDIKEDYEESSFVTQNRDLILGYFYSLLSATLKEPSHNFQHKKGQVWRGLGKDNVTMFLKIAKNIISKADHFKENEQLNNIIQELEPYIQSAEEQQQSLAKLLKKEQQVQQQQNSENGKRKMSSSSVQKQQEQQEQLGFNLTKQLSFLNLFVGIIIQSLIYTEEGTTQVEEVSVLREEIVKYYEEKEAAENPKKKRKLNNKTPEESSQEQPEFTNVLVDMLVSFLTRSASYLRDIINVCFGCFVGEISEQGLSLLTGVICRDNEEYIQEMAGEGELMDEEDDESIEDEENDDEEEEEQVEEE